MSTHVNALHLDLTEMGGLFWITQRNHSSLQIQAARLAHIPL